MALSADLVQIAIVKEVDYGVTPATPQFEVLPITGEGVAANVSKTDSNMMTSDRQVLDSIVTNITAEGDLSTELTITPAMEILIESAMANDLVDIAPAISGRPPLSETIIGQDQISFTIEKRFPDPVTPGSFIYHRIPGCVTNTFNMTASAGEPATITASVLGTTLVPATTIITGATYITPVNPTILRGPDVITLNVEGHSVSANCFGDFSIDLNNNYRGLLCLGYLGNKEMAISKANVTLSATVHFVDNTLLQALLDQTETAVDYEMTTGAAIDPGVFFASYFPRVKLDGDEIVAGGTGEDVVNKLTMTSLFNSAGTLETLGLNNADKTSMRIVVGEGALTP